ncbi:MAG: rhomboid family intramembrane serine protease [Saprospiraceae bacterium]|nr:rhomboid family intramembrane serine protease [Saprospiraceae bacterium]
MIFPIGDTQVIGGHKPYLSYGLLILTSLVFAVQMLMPGNLICDYAVIPNNIRHGNELHTLVTSLFLHGSYLHIVGNLIFLWVFADNIEATIGHGRFIAFYLVGGIVASLAHIYMDGQGSALINCCEPCISCEPGMQACIGSIPSLGASGSISAIMGAYLIMYPRSKVEVLILIFFRKFFMSAWIFLGLWFVQQIFAGIGSFNVPSAANEGVAWWAHIGGFAFGLASGLIFRKYISSPKGSFIDNEDLI